MKLWIGGGGAVALLIVAAVLWTRGGPHGVPLPISAPAAAETVTAAAEAPLVVPVSDVTAADREARRFKRYDKDKDGNVTRDEYLASRRKAFARLDVDGDGKLSFDEYSVKAIAKFNAADTNHDARLIPAEFATTAVKRKPRTRPVCQPGTAETTHDDPANVS
ncbi:MAG: EF-hand domain-containing protein [Janthinobacterium lividum]